MVNFLYTSRKRGGGKGKKAKKRVGTLKKNKTLYIKEE